jgi:hypothetical protein
MKKMEIGHLNLQKPRIDQFSYAQDIQTRAYDEYSRLVETSEIGKKVLEAIEGDARARSLNGRMISTGNGASRYEPKTLAMWHVWAINEFGEETAHHNLNHYLDSNEVPVLSTLWVLGIEVEETIELTHGLKIVPASQMPDSREKEHYLKYDFHILGHQHPKPKSAIVFETTVRRDFDSEEDPALGFEQDKKFWDSSKLLYETSLALNVIENVSCIPYFATSYTLPTLPIGLFGGSGGGFSLHDVIGHSTSKISAEQAEEINKVLDSFFALNESEKKRFHRILSRLSQSKRRHQIEDKLLDLGIALEMALLEDNSNNQQLSLSFRLRGAWLIAEGAEQRAEVYRQLRMIYDYRSQVAHSGVLCGNDAEKINAVSEKYPEFCNLAEKILHKLICKGKPEWSKLLLGVI